MRFIANPRYTPTATKSATILPLHESKRILTEIGSWPGYVPTPLVSLPGLASNLRIKKLWLKDEGARFGVKSFKPMGGGYAVSQLVARIMEADTGSQPSVEELFGDAAKSIGNGITVACATEGNHGRAVAWAARLFGCNAVVYMAHNVTPKREQAIASFGARIVRSQGNHEDAMREMVHEAGPAGWHIISETKSATDEYIPRDTLAGYGALILEAFGQLDGDVPTHLFIQAGVGGLAAATSTISAQMWPDRVPKTIVVESVKADCVCSSLETGRRVTVDGLFDTMMLGLAAGEVSHFAWELLEHGAAGGIAIDDTPAVAAMRMLASPESGDPPVAVGESGVAGIAALIKAANNAECREVFGLDETSIVMTIGTEGVTDPDTYRAIVGL